MASHAALASSRIPGTTRLTGATPKSMITHPATLSFSKRLEVPEFSGLRSTCMTYAAGNGREASFFDAVAAQVTPKDQSVGRGTKTSRGRGRPPKPKNNEGIEPHVAVINANLLENQQEQPVEGGQLSITRGRGRGKGHGRGMERTTNRNPTLPHEMDVANQEQEQHVEEGQQTSTTHSLPEEIDIVDRQEERQKAIEKSRGKGLLTRGKGCRSSRRH